MEKIEITADVIQGFVAGVLLPSYDDPKPIPTFHKEVWELFCLDHDKVAIAASRGHAKTSAGTHAFSVVNALFRNRSHIMIVSDTEDQACAFLADIKMELEENEKIEELFGAIRFLKDKESEVVCQMEDGYMFRILARGSNQKLRGLKWRHKRPDLILCHEEGTKIYADGKWILNTEHPTAKKVTTDGFKITFDDGTTEVISKDHRYWIEGKGWVFATDLVEGMEVGGECLLMNKEELELMNIAENTESGIGKKLKLLKMHTANVIKNKFVKSIKNGLKNIQNRIRFIKLNIAIKINIKLWKKLVDTEKKIKAGWLHNVLRGGLRKSQQRLFGLMKDILPYFINSQKSNQKELVVQYR